jgi:alkylation response protein AidB-like acyl-CoA dehydrogenase
MELTLNTAQRDLRDAVARVCADRFGRESLAAREHAPIDRSSWRELAALGVLGLLVPESAGGTGLGVAEAVVVFEQFGRHLAPGVPGPLLWSVLAAAFVDGVTEGERVVGGVDAAEAGGETFVEHLVSLDDVLLLRRDGLFLCGAEDLAATPMEAPLDPLVPVARVSAIPMGEGLAGPPEARRLRDVGTVLCAALQLGVAATALEVARRHALEREQFGVPIGSFQAIKHLLADAYVRMTLAASATQNAAAVLDGTADGDQRRAVSGAKLLAGEAAVSNARTAVQILGGMGFTWEMPPNYLLKRALVLEGTFGSGRAHALRIGTALAR